MFHYITVTKPAIRCSLGYRSWSGRLKADLHPPLCSQDGEVQWQHPLTALPELTAHLAPAQLTEKASWRKQPWDVD